MINVVVDTNVHIAALGWKNGHSARIIDKVILGEVDLIVSDQLMGELKEVVSRSKFDFLIPISKKIYISNIITVAQFVECPGDLKVISEDPSDDKFLECAVLGGADYIVSGDKHLLQLGEYSGIKIVSPREFCRILSFV